MFDWLLTVVINVCCRLISFVEFQAFEAMLCTPDAMYALAFQIFDTNSSGYVTYGEVTLTWVIVMNWQSSV